MNQARKPYALEKQLRRLGQRRPAKTAKARAGGLQKYIQEENKKGKQLWGGIVTLKGGSWRYNDNGEYEYSEGNLSGWKVLS